MRTRSRYWLLPPLFVFLLLAATHTLWFPLLGRYLVQSEQPDKAEAIVVLAGDYLGKRIITAAELAKAGFAPLVIVSGPTNVYGRSEADLAIEFIVAKGYPKEWFRGVNHESDNTREESVVLCGNVRRSRLNKLLLVTSDFHTRRAGTVFRQACQGIDVRVIAADDATFIPDNWWRSRRMAKTFLFEWMKTVAYWFGI